MAPILLVEPIDAIEPTDPIEKIEPTENADAIDPALPKLAALPGPRVLMKRSAVAGTTPGKA